MKSNNTARSGLVLAAARLLVLPALLCLTPGCAHTMRVNVKPATLPACDKSPARIALVLNKDFTEYKHTLSSMGDSYVSPLGAPLQEYAKNVTQHVFSEVSVHPTAAEAAGKADAILIPKVTKFDESYGLWAASKHQVVMIMEWNLKDRDNQKDLWLDSIDARGEGKMGNGFTYKGNHLKVMQRLFDDLSAKTQKALVESPEIRQLGIGAPR
jgi:hypothetical protein